MLYSLPYSFLRPFSFHSEHHFYVYVLKPQLRIMQENDNINGGGHLLSCISALSLFFYPVLISLFAQPNKHIQKY